MEERYVQSISPTSSEGEMDEYETEMREDIRNIWRVCHTGCS